MAPTVVLITGANRGIGNGLLKLYLARPNYTVIAANRDPEHPSSKSLFDLPTAEGTSLHVIKIDATIRADPSKAVETLHSKGIHHIDILVANAGIALSYPKVRDVETDEIQKHILVNVFGFLWLFQAMRPMLKNANNPIWATIGSSAAILTVISIVRFALECPSRIVDGPNTIRRNMLPMQNAAYAPTKLMLHWYTKAIHIEETWLTAVPIDPGWVQTDLGDHGAHSFGIEKAAITVEESTEGVIKVIDAATRDTHGGKLWRYDGEEIAW